MGDDDGRASLADLLQHFTNLPLGILIQSRCRLVEDEDGGVVKKHPCQ